jgi:hypothetical protein
MPHQKPDVIAIDVEHELIRRRTGGLGTARTDGHESSGPATGSDRYAFARGPTLSLDSC